MGSPVSSVVANLFMEALRKRRLEQQQRMELNQGFGRRRYVDDVFSLIKKDRAEKFLVHLNSQQNIRFTCEKEEDHRFPFLDVQVERKRKKLMTSVFRKKTYMNRVLAFDSHHSNNAKRAVIILCLTEESLISEEMIDTDRKNKENICMHCSKRMVTRGHLFRALYGIAKQIERNERRERARKRKKKEPKDTIVLPCIKGGSEQIKGVLILLDIRVVNRADKWTWSLSHGIKDSIPVEKQTGVVYEISCKDCDDRYIGETLRSIRDTVGRASAK